MRAANAARLSSLVASSHWRRSRLLILCYHGIALNDEDRWNPGLYVSAAHFRRRMEILRRMGCAVLPLDDALRRLHADALPARSVVLTFDDGFYDVYSVAWPILREFSLPATVYLTTYYVDRNWPVFGLLCSYLLWKSSRTELRWPEVLGAPVTLDDAGRRQVSAALSAYCDKNDLSGRQKDALAGELAGRLDVDAGLLRAQRVLHLMNPGEVGEVARQGADIQLHTHRHCVCRFPRVLEREIAENGRRIQELTGRTPAHFCYPSGVVPPGSPVWLRDCGALSATTCEAGIASGRTAPFVLPRLLDSSGITDVEFAAWVSGTAALLPRRSISGADGALIEEPLVEVRTASRGS